MRHHFEKLHKFAFSVQREALIMTSYETIDWKQVGAETEIWDVRSPSEFAEDHIPGARNVPVLDEERAEVGSLYRRDPFQARKLGAAYIAEKCGQAFTEHPSSPRRQSPSSRLLLARRTALSKHRDHSIACWMARAFACRWLQVIPPRSESRVGVPPGTATVLHPGRPNWRG